MHSTRHAHRSPWRRVLVALVTAAMTLQVTGTAAAQDTDGYVGGFCPPVTDFRDADRIPDEHRCNVGRAAVLGIVHGFPDGEFKARLPVTRGQMASFLFRALRVAEIRLPDPAAQRFSDVPAGSAHDEAIHRLAAAGIMRGGPVGLGGDMYGPQLTMRRDQMAASLMRAVGYARHDDPDHFADWPANAPDDAVLGRGYPDVPPDNVHYGNVHAANWYTIAVGFLDGTFRPAATVRRDQMASSSVGMVVALGQATQVAITGVQPGTGAPGESVTVTATVTDQYGLPRDGLDEVRFLAEGPGVDPAETVTATTGEHSQATFAFTATQEGTVTVRAWIDGPGGNYLAADGDSDTVEVVFAAPGS